MNAPLFCQILEQTLFNHFFKKDFLLLVHIDLRKIMTSSNVHARYAQRFYEEAGMNWWHTPPESPDLNPIENLGHELKDYLLGQQRMNYLFTSP